MDNKKNSLFVRIVAVMLAVLMAMSVLATIIASTMPRASAAPSQSALEELKKKRKLIQQEMDEIKSQIHSLEYEQEVAMGKKRILDRQIDLTQQGIDNLTEQSEQYGVLIVEKELEVQELQAQEEAQWDLYKVRLRAMEENGNVSYYAIIFGARDFADMLSRMDIVERITAHDKTLYNNLVSAKEATEAAKADLENTVTEMAATQDELEEEQLVLMEQVAEALAIIDALNLSIEEQKELLEATSEEEDKLKEEILKMQKALEEQHKTVVGTGRFIWPTTASNKVTSKFGPRNTGIKGASTNHKGIDIGAAYGTKVLACDSGKVLTATYSNSYGYYVTISHGNGYTTLYGHMSKLLVKAGDTVKQGDTIGLCGATGIANGAHIHLEIWVNGVRVDPLKYFDSKTYRT